MLVKRPSSTFPIQSARDHVLSAPGFQTEPVVESTHALLAAVPHPPQGSWGLSPSPLFSHVALNSSPSSIKWK